MDAQKLKVRIGLALVGCLLGAALCIPWDIELSFWFRSIRLRGDLNKFLQLSESLAHLLSIAFLFLCLLWIDVRQRPRLWAAIALVLISSGLSNLAKGIIPRLRPHGLDALPLEMLPQSSLEVWGVPFTESWFVEEIRSFPSGHSATAVAVAIGLTFVYPRGKWFFVFIAFLACIQRVECGAHYFSDVLGGIAVALLCTLAMLPIFQRANLASLSQCCEGKPNEHTPV